MMALDAWCASGASDGGGWPENLNLERLAEKRDGRGRRAAWAAAAKTGAGCHRARAQAERGGGGVAAACRAPKGSEMELCERRIAQTLPGSTQLFYSLGLNAKNGEK